MRDLTDTFHQTTVTLRRDSGEEIDLLAGLKPDDAGSYGAVNGERYAQDDRPETVERWLVSFNRDYLNEQGLIDPDTDKVLIAEEDRIVIKGKRFVIVTLTDKALFRGLPILFSLTVQR